MATTTVYTYRCPRCRADIGRRFGLITTKLLVCPNCGSNVRIDSNVIQQNWAYNFGWVSGLFAWFALAVAVLASPDCAAAIGGNTFPSATMENRLAIAGMCAIPSMLGGLLFAGVGMLLGALVAADASEDSAPAGGFSSSPTPGQWPGGGFPFPSVPPGRQPSQPPAAGYNPPTYPTASQPQPRRRSILVRGFFVLLWPVVFFFGAAMVLNMVAGNGVKKDEPPPVAGARTVGLMGSPLGQGPLLAASSLIPDNAKAEQLKQQAVEKLAAQAAPWLLLGMLVVFLLGCAGVLPSTGRNIGRPAAAQPGLSGPGQQTQPPAASSGPEPQRRGILVRGFFTLLWPVVFFFAAGFTMSALAGSMSAENEQVRNQIFEQSAQANVAWILLVSLLLFIAGCLGVLPGTGSKKRSRAAAQAAPARPAPAPGPVWPPAARR